MRNLSKTLPLSMGLIFCLLFNAEVYSQNHSPVVIDTSFDISHSLAEFYMSYDLALDEDYDIDENSYKILVPPRKGTAFFKSDGRWMSMYYIPPKDIEPLVDTISYSVCDATGLCDSGLLIVKVARDEPPVLNVIDWYYSYLSKDSGNIYNRYSMFDAEDDLNFNSFKIVQAPKYCTFTLDSMGNYTLFTKIQDVKDTVIYNLCDNSGQCTNGYIYITVDKNYPPKAYYQSYTIGNNTILKDFLNAYDDNYSVNAVSILKSPNKGDFQWAFGNDNTLKFQYSPYKDIVGSDTINYKVCDTDGLCDSAIITIDIIQNSPPTAVDDIFEVRPNSNVGGSVATNDFDIDYNLDPLSYELIKLPKLGQLQGTIDGNFNYYSYGTIGRDTLLYRVKDYMGLWDTALIIFVIKDIQYSGTIASNKQILKNITTFLNRPVKYPTITYGNIIVRSNTNGTSCEVKPNLINIQQPQNGNATDYFTDYLTYTPNKNFLGNDTLINIVSYILHTPCFDESKILTDTLFYVFTVLDNNFAKVSLETLKNSTIVSDKAKKPSGTQLSSNIVMSPSHGRVFIDNNNRVYYTPFNDFIGPDVFTIQICNSVGQCDTTLFEIDVLDPAALSPYASNDYVSTNINTPVSGSVALNDIGSGNLHFQSLTILPITKGELIFEESGKFTFTPALNFTGKVYVDYRVWNDYYLSDTASLTIDVMPIFRVQTPPVAVNDSFIAFKNTTITGSVALNDTDFDKNIKNNGFNILKTPKSGILILNSNGNFTYNPNKDFIGSDTASYVVCDSTNLCDTAFIFFKINDLPVKHAPSAQNDYFTTDENTPLSNTVASNDSDEDFDLKPNSFKILKTVKNGILIFKEEGSFLYTPNSNFVGPDTASYTVCDTTGLCDTAIIYITVKKVYHQPTLVEDVFTNVFNTALKGSLAINDSDVDNDFNKNTYQIASNPKNGNVKIWSNGNFIYLPKYNFVGKDTFIYKACDARNLCSQAICIVATRGGSLIGRVYIDENKDGVLNTDEVALANIPIKVNDRVSTFTNKNGEYSILVDTSTSYVIAPVFTSNLYTLTPLSKAIMTGSSYNQVIENQDFIVLPKQPESDLRVVVEQGNARPGFVSNTILAYTNKGNTVLKGSLNIKLDFNLSYSSADVEPSGIQGNRLTWNFENLKPFETRYINIMNKTSVNASLGSSTEIKYEGILTILTDSDTSNNSGVSIMQVRGSFDPNDIKVDVETVKQVGSVRETIVPLTYTIRFQNTGTAEAYRVEVVDTLSEKLDISSIEMIAASHPFEMKVVEDNTLPNNTVLKWIFNNINLVDSTTKEACSHGFIKYKINNIKERTNYWKDSILNKAAIYFDFNQPIITNTASTVFSFSTPTQDIEFLTVNVYPNPVSEYLTVLIDDNIREGIVEIANIYGQVVYRDILRGSRQELDIAHFAKGTYLLTVKNGNKKGMMKVVKQ